MYDLGQLLETFLQRVVVDIFLDQDGSSPSANLTE